jgi:hypothetical protein
LVEEVIDTADPVGKEVLFGASGRTGRAMAPDVHGTVGARFCCRRRWEILKLWQPEVESGNVG